MPQAGIGTYVVSSSLSHTGIRARFNSWFTKAKDSAIGSSFDQHVVGGYRFLMRFYSPGDEIFIFGFSRGAYIARFLAEMLDHVGLLSHGNEEMVSFAWKAFSQWQRRRSSHDPNAQQKRRDMYSFLRGFRETFSRPVRRIRFLGLFDTVNSVPQFEAAWMERSKFPYTARSSARVIRHAVSIDERRAKFRQDLMYQSSIVAAERRRLHALHAGAGHARQALHSMQEKLSNGTGTSGAAGEQHQESSRGRDTLAVPNVNGARAPATDSDDDQPERYRVRSRSRAARSASRTRPSADGASQIGRADAMSEGCSSEDDDTQDIDEVWFSGGHGDVGGGWEIPPDGKSASHVPLAWMVREAIRAGLSFDMDKVRAMGCIDCTDELEQEEENAQVAQAEAAAAGETYSHHLHHLQQQDHPQIIPDIKIRSPGGGSTPTALAGSLVLESSGAEGSNSNHAHAGPTSAFHGLMHKAHTARIHDSLEFNSDLGFGAVMAWKVMEYLPFRRMDLQSNGSWKPIRWPLPRGEVRDIPHNARVHGSVIRRMRMDEKYRPGNLIVGGGGRGCRVAPKDHGMGDWICVAERGDAIGEVWMRKDAVTEGLL